MKTSGDALRRALTEPLVFLNSALFWLRWIIIGAMLLISLVWPLASRTGHPIWAYLLVFAAYNLLAELLRQRLPRLRPARWVPLLDLPIAGLLYFFDAEPTGPLFGLFYVAVVSAAICLPLVATLVYTAITIALVALIAPTLPLWAGTTMDIRHLGVRLAILSLVGIGTAVLCQQLVREAAAARSSRDEAERLAELDRLRSEFIASISHELRTPLTANQASLGLLELSASDRLTADERQLLANARRNAERLKLLIDDLIAFNQLEAGALQLDHEPLDVRAVVREAVTAVQPLMGAKAQTLTLDLPEPLPIAGDGRRLEQVLVNLLANAYQHTPTGTRITVTGQVTDGHIELTISDTGPGIPPEQLEAIFQRFHRLDPHTGGSGLGLAIARALIELHGGRVWAESQPGQGTTLHLTLPCYVQEERHDADAADR